MATLNGTVWSVHTVKGDAVQPLQHAVVLFNVSGTYVQADNAQLQDVDDAIADSRRNGKTITLKDAMLWQCAAKESDPSLLMGLKTVAVSGADVTFEITETATAWSVETSTELAAGAVPAQSTPFGILVSFTES